MADMDEIISNLKNCILVYKYPLADSMDDDQIADIFSRSNRCFLVSWIINLLNLACECTLQNMKNSETYLAKLIHNMGFCQQKESAPFMRGDLPMKTELQIIEKMFNALKRATQSVPQVQITKEEIVQLKTMDLNLFPVYGDIKIANPKGKKLTENSPRAPTSNKIVKVVPTEDINEKIDLTLRNLQDEFPKLTEKIRELEKTKQSRKTEPVKVDEDSVKVLKKCDENLKIISQYLLDRKTIREFNKLNQTEYVPSDSSPNKESRDLLKNVCEQCADVARYAYNKD